MASKRGRPATDGRFKAGPDPRRALLGGKTSGSFKSGPDGRRARTGGVPQERRVWARSFGDVLAKKVSVERVVAKLAEAVERGREWAIKEVLDRICGKPVQPSEQIGEMNFHITYEDKGE